MNTIGNKLCVSIANKNFQECYEISSNYNFIELRLDLLDLSNNQLQKLFALKTAFIATYRENLNQQNKNKEKILLNALNLGAQFVDIEIDADQYTFNTITKFAKTLNKKLIISYHNYTKTPTKTELQNIINSAKKHKPNYIKIVTTANNKADVSRILSLYEKNTKIIAFAMGEIGKISRIASLFLGSDFTYTSAEKGSETAPGQYNYLTLSEVLKKI